VIGVQELSSMKDNITGVDLVIMSVGNTTDIMSVRKFRRDDNHSDWDMHKQAHS